MIVLCLLYHFNANLCLMQLDMTDHIHPQQRLNAAAKVAVVIVEPEKKINHDISDNLTLL